LPPYKFSEKLKRNKPIFLSWTTSTIEDIRAENSSNDEITNHFYGISLFAIKKQLQTI